MCLENYLIFVLCPIVLEYADVDLFNCKKNVEFANILLKNGINPNITKNGHSALLSASYNKYWELAKLLLKYGAYPEPTSFYCNNPLHYASKYGQLKYINMLIDKGAYIGRINNDKMTSLMIAASMKNNDKCIKLLLDKGADSNAKNINGQTALLISSFCSQWKNMKALITHVRNLNPTTRFGNTPMYYASSQNKWKCVRLLLIHGADPNIRGKNGYTPLDCAIINKHSECIKLLKNIPRKNIK